MNQRPPNPLKRERLAWLVASLLLAMLAFQLNGSLAHREDDYAFVRTLIDVHRQVARNYVDAVDEEKLRQGAIDGMLGQLDPYSNYIPPARQEAFESGLDGTFKGIGVELSQAENGEIRVISPIEDSPAFRAGVMAGDVILKINGDDVRGLKVDQVRTKISGGPLVVTMRVRHETGEEVDLPPMTRQQIVLPTVKGYKRKLGRTGEWDWYADPEHKIAYVRVLQFTPETSERVEGVLRKLVEDGMQSLILDLRFNPGGRLESAEKLVDLFVPNGVIVVTKGRNRPQVVAKAKKDGGPLETIPLAVLINEHSASASEVVAGSLQDHRRAVVVGERTFGKGSVQEVIGLDDREGALKLTVAYYYLPSGRLVHKKPGEPIWGVDPQIRIEMTQEQEKDLTLAQSDNDVIGRSGTTRPSSTRSTTRSTTSPVLGPLTRPTNTSVDPQLDAAVKALVDRIPPGPPPVPATQAAAAATGT